MKPLLFSQKKKSSMYLQVVTVLFKFKIDRIISFTLGKSSYLVLKRLFFCQFYPKSFLGQI